MHYNEANSYLFVNDTEIIKFKTKDYEILAAPLCLGNISKNFSIDNMKYEKDRIKWMFMILMLIMKLMQLMIY